jgi:hypothetical protein
MRLATVSVFLVLLGGCAVVPPSAWNFDPGQPRAKNVLPAAEFAALADRVASLQAERTGIRARIAGEGDVWQRQREYGELHRVGMALSPLERQLAAATPAP